MSLSSCIWDLVGFTISSSFFYSSHCPQLFYSELVDGATLFFSSNDRVKDLGRICFFSPLFPCLIHCTKLNLFLGGKANLWRNFLPYFFFAFPSICQTMHWAVRGTNRLRKVAPFMFSESLQSFPFSINLQTCQWSSSSVLSISRRWTVNSYLITQLITYWIT